MMKLPILFEGCEMPNMVAAVAFPARQAASSESTLGLSQADAVEARKC